LSARRLFRFITQILLILLVTLVLLEGSLRAFPRLIPPFLLADFNPATRALVAEPQALFQVMLAGLILAFLWYAYIRLPKFIRDLFQTIWRKPKKDR
jgi:hypothetical protein